jgi:hypothetical protein
MEVGNGGTRPGLPDTVENIVIVMPDEHKHQNQMVVEDKLEKWLERVGDGEGCRTNDNEYLNGRPSLSTKLTSTNVALPPELVDATTNRVHRDAEWVAMPVIIRLGDALGQQR